MLIVVALGVALGGCSSAVGMTKVTGTRATVPAPEPAALPNVQGPFDPALALDKLRMVDVCKLLNNDLLNSVGKPDPKDKPSRDRFGSCAAALTDPEGKPVHLVLALGDGSISSEKADKRIAGLPAQIATQFSSCFVDALTQVKPFEVPIQVQVSGDTRDKCGIGREVLDTVLREIKAGAPQLTRQSGDLVGLDPCSVVDPAVAQAVTGPSVTSYPSGIAQCTWKAGRKSLMVTFNDATIDPKDDTLGGALTPLDVGGVTAYQRPEQPRCTITWLQKPTAVKTILGSPGESVQVITEDDNLPQPPDLCAGAATAAKAVRGKLPKP